MAHCKRCSLDLDKFPPSEPGLCPNCGCRETVADTGTIETATPPAAVNVAPTGPGEGLALAGRFFANLRDLIFAPSRFFSREGTKLVQPGGVSAALAFAVIVQWLAAFFNFVWQSVVGVVMQSRFDDFNRIVHDMIRQQPGGLPQIGSLEEMRKQAFDVLFGAGAIILTPFTTLLKLVFMAALIHMAARFIIREVADRPLRYSTTLKILAYASAPWILCIIPVFGWIAGWVLVFAAGVLGVREVYKTTTWRSVWVVAFPDLLVMAILLAFALIAVFLAFNVLRLVS